MPTTGKASILAIVTIGHRQNAVMDEEGLMRHNLAFMKQIGQAQ